MDNNQQSTTVKILVDVLSASLQNLSEKINSIQPVLNNVSSSLDKQITEINKIVFDTQSISKLLDTSVSDFYDRTNKILENLNLIKMKMEDLSQIDDTIEKCNVESKKFIEQLNSVISNLNNSIDSLKVEIKPVIKLSNWITKPIGIIIFIIGLIFASITIINGVNSIVEYFHTTSQIINNQNRVENASNK